MPAHQDGGARAEGGGKRDAETCIADQHVGIAGNVANLEQRAAFSQEPAHVKDRLQRRSGDAERDHVGRVAVHDRLHVWAHAIDLRVDETLEVDAPSRRIDRRAVEVEGDDILAPDQTRRHVARKQEMIGRLIVTNADMAETVDDALSIQNAIRQDELVD